MKYLGIEMNVSDLPKLEETLWEDPQGGSVRGSGKFAGIEVSYAV